MSYSIVEKGALHSLSYRLYLASPKGDIISPFHDIPLFANEYRHVFNMVVEVPRWTNAKMEISKDDKLNPIKQDTKKGKLRFVNNVFPHHGYIWNYGALPQTWENPAHMDTHTGQKGDNDPIDVCEIGYKVRSRGDVVQVKVLGVMALIDEGETDWKVLAIDVTDPLADRLNDVNDIDTEMPGFLQATREWFKVYKMPTGKPANQFAFNGEAKDKQFALNVITETHEQWKRLVSGQDTSDIELMNTSVDGSSFKVDVSEACRIVEENPPNAPAEPIHDKVNKWDYVRL